MLSKDENHHQSHPSVKPMSYNDWPDDICSLEQLCQECYGSNQLLSDYI